ncbi:MULTISPECIES: DUF2628 domain-containing protein [unclassified Bosea (in: a-proteobacteria)]|uniref:DUF2628 domain-containing protein n=1 Tax=unclassified Bosea (in: a-proteobacteria) TaxID=2653178 RepID=UPI00095550B7|nr:MULTISPECIES: DUF2628 domain-containing protein [unclassified Bosea (in: a-proteobacteria)]TAJ31218.1 MAG: DUF2628 domain-containing protein [Bosea sp. (in: a-proteobacteria)]SIQ95576.1 Protein of unknown function [Bosea sp. TND4EK4]
MAFYTVMTPPAAETGLREAVEQARVIPDSFSWGAFLLTGLWLLGRRLWLATLLFVLFWGAVWFVHGRFGFHDSALSLLYWMVALFLGLEGRNLVVRKLVRQGWQLADVVEARDLADAERRWFERALSEQPALPLPQPAPTSAMSRPSGPLPIIGLFPEARGR